MMANSQPDILQYQEVEAADLEPRIYASPEYLADEANDRSEEVTNPSTLRPVGHRTLVGPSTIAASLERAKRAQTGWAKLDAKTRAGYLHRIADAIESADPARVSILLTAEMGKPYPESVGEIANCGAIFRYYAEMARDDDGKVAGTTQTGSFQYARYHPYGVSLHIMPFNFPILLMCWTVAASLAAGNASIVKPAEATTLSTLAFMSAFDGLPEGLVHCLPGGAETAVELLESEDINAVAFTGSVAVGKKVAVACARQLKPAVIEAGGSDAMIISDSAPMDVAVAGAITAAFHLSGQICTSAERFFVVDAVHDEFVEKLAAAASKLRIGDGMSRSEIGPMVSEAARSKVQRLVAGAVEQGARLVCGGDVVDSAGPGWFYAPTVLADVNDSMAVMQEECFGPVASICRVRDFEVALERANASRFGLGASVFTTRLDEAMHAAETLQSGMVWVNNPLIDNDALPFGGWKSSGVGRELGRLGLDAFRQSKMVIVDHKPTVQEWWYPYPDDWFYDAGGRKL